jgi:aminopeptidase N
LKSIESQKALSPLRLLRRADGALARKSELGDEVLVSKKQDGTWDIYQNGSSEALGIWRDAPKPTKVKRDGLLGFFGFKKTVQQPPDKAIDPGEVRELFFVDNDIQGKEVYRQVDLPQAPAPKPWKAKHYEVSMQIDPKTNVVNSKSRITGIGLAQSQSIPLDFHGFAGSTKVIGPDGQERDFHRTKDGVKIYSVLEPQSEFSIDVTYSGSPERVSHPGVPADLGWLSTDSSTVTFNGAANPSSWLPGDDSPSNKATYGFQIEVPKNHFAVANGKLIEEKVLPNGGKSFHYRSRFPMASYLASVNTFDESKFARTMIAPEFEVVHPKDMEAQVRSEFKNHTKMMGFLEQRLGNYPFESYGAIVTDLPVDSYKTRFTDGENTYEADSKFEVAFEAQTRPIFQAESITGDGEFEPTIIHEMAHQWFGNAVTNASQKDVWVNEAFPSYSGWLWVEEQKGSEAFEQEMEGIYDTVKDHKFTDTMANPDRDKLFSQENYARMTLSMHALRRKLGDDQFYKTLQGAVKEHQYESVDVPTLAHTMNVLNGGTLGGFFHQWLHQTELPPYPEKKD